MEKYLKEADVPLVGNFANDTENRFTAGIDNNSEEIKKKKKSCCILFFSKGQTAPRQLSGFENPLNYLELLLEMAEDV